MLWVQRALGRKTNQMSGAGTSVGVGGREGLSWLCRGWLRAEGNHFPACQSHSTPLFTTLVILTGIVGSGVVQEPNGISCGTLEKISDLPRFDNDITLKHRVSCR